MITWRARRGIHRAFIDGHHVATVEHTRFRDDVDPAWDWSLENAALRDGVRPVTWASFAWNLRAAREAAERSLRDLGWPLG